MSTQPGFVDGILAMIAERRDVLTELETAILKVQRVFSAPVTAALSVPPGPAAVPAPAKQLVGRVARVSKRASQRPSTASARTRPRVDRGEVTAAIDAFLDKQRRPTTMAAVVSAAGANPAIVRGILDQMVQARTLVRTGSRAGMRLGRPAVMAAETSEGNYILDSLAHFGLESLHGKHISSSASAGVNGFASVTVGMVLCAGSVGLGSHPNRHPTL